MKWLKYILLFAVVPYLIYLKFFKTRVDVDKNTKKIVLKNLSKSEVKKIKASIGHPELEGRISPINNLIVTVESDNTRVE